MGARVAWRRGGDRSITALAVQKAALRPSHLVRVGVRVGARVRVKVRVRFGLRSRVGVGVRVRAPLAQAPHASSRAAGRNRPRAPLHPRPHRRRRRSHRSSRSRKARLVRFRGRVGLGLGLELGLHSKVARRTAVDLVAGLDAAPAHVAAQGGGRGRARERMLPRATGGLCIERRARRTRRARFYDRARRICCARCARHRRRGNTPTCASRRPTAREPLTWRLTTGPATLRSPLASPGRRDRRCSTTRTTRSWA